MVFSSAAFLFVFLPLLFLLYCLLPGVRGKNGVLILGSLIFYGAGQPAYVLLLLASVLCNYGGGRAVAGAHRKAALTLTVSLNLALLAVFKYLGFFVENFNLLFHQNLPVPDIPLPVGISFFTFQGMSYVIDVYREPALVSRRFWKVLLYVSLFPQLVAGPIVKYKDLEPQLTQRRAAPREMARRCGVF